jgi:acyl carrier protein
LSPDRAEIGEGLVSEQRNRHSEKSDETVKSADEIRRELRDLIISELVPLEEDELSDDSQLVDDVLDSLGIAEVAIFIEDRIGRPLTEAEETRTTFASINSVVEFIVKNR